MPCECDSICILVPTTHPIFKSLFRRFILCSRDVLVTKIVALLTLILSPLSHIVSKRQFLCLKDIAVY